MAALDHIMDRMNNIDESEPVAQFPGVLWGHVPPTFEIMPSPFQRSFFVVVVLFLLDCWFYSTLNISVKVSDHVRCFNRPTVY